MSYSKPLDDMYWKSTDELSSMYGNIRTKQPLNWAAADDIVGTFLGKERAEFSVGIFSDESRKDGLLDSHEKYIDGLAHQYKDIYMEAVLQRPADRETEEIAYDAFMTFIRGSHNTDITAKAELKNDVESARKAFNKKYKRNLIFRGLSLMGRPF